MDSVDARAETDRRMRVRPTGMLLCAMAILVPLARGAAVIAALATSPPALHAAAGLATVTMALPFVNVLPAGFWAAKDRGFFRKYGIDLQIVTFRGSTQAMPALLAGQVSVMLGSPGQGLAAAAAGEDVIGLATIGPKMPYFFMARPEIRSPPDLRGKTIGISGTGLSAARIATILALKRFGLEPRRDNITLVPTGTMPERLAALLNNAIQGTVIDRTETPPSALSGSGLTLLADFGQFNIPWEHDIVMTTRRYLAANRAVVEGLLKGLLEGNAYILAPQDKRVVLRIIAEQLHLDNVQRAETLYQDAVANFIVRKPFINRKTLATMVDVVADEFPALLKVDLDRFVDDSILVQLDRSGFIDRLGR